MDIKKFLKQPEVQELLDQENLDEIYFQYAKLGGDVSELTKFFISSGINFLDYVTFVPPYAYWNTNIESIKIPNNVKAIYKDAFSECTSLRVCNIEDGLEIIEEFAFDGCENLSHIELPNTLNIIGHYAFRDCKSLFRVHLPESLKAIALNAFYGCSNMIAVVKEGSYAHRHCLYEEIEFEIED